MVEMRCSANACPKESTIATLTVISQAQYKVEHILENNSGTYPNYPASPTEIETLTGTIGTGVILLAKSYTGYTLDGAYTGNISTGTVLADGSLVLRQYYAIDRFALTFEENGGSTVSDQTNIPYNTPATKPTDPTKTGYAFDGWFTESALQNPYNFSSGVTTDSTLYAKWAPITTPYSIEHYLQSADLSYPSGASITESLTGMTDSLVSASSKTFTGYTLDTTIPGTIHSGTIATDGGLVLKLYYKRDAYTVSYEENGGTDVPDQANVLYDTLATKPTNPTKTGATFSGWYLTGSSTPFDFATPIRQNTTLSALWIQNTYTVRFFDHDGTQIGSGQVVSYGLNAIAPSSPTRTGYTFSGWSGGILTNITRDIDLLAQYTINQYTITFDSNSGSAVAPITANYGSSVTPPVSPTRTGYTFSGWSPVLPSTMPAQNMTLIAQWKADTSTNAPPSTVAGPGGGGGSNTITPIVPNSGNTPSITTPPTTDIRLLPTQSSLISAGTTPSGQQIFTLENRVTDYVCPQVVKVFDLDELVVRDVSSGLFQDDIRSLMMFRGLEKDELSFGQTYEEYRMFGVVNNVRAFEPYRTVTRAEYVKMLVRSLSCRYTYMGTDTGFPDVSEKMWYAEYIKFAVANGWINGYRDGDFRPNAPITRDEAAKILSRAIQLNTKDTDIASTPFTDVAGSLEFLPYIETLREKGIFRGKTETRFDPKAYIPRTETSRVIYRTFLGGKI